MIKSLLRDVMSLFYEDETSITDAQVKRFGIGFGIVVFIGLIYGYIGFFIS